MGKFGMQMLQYLAVVLVVDAAVDDVQAPVVHTFEGMHHGVDAVVVVGRLADGQRLLAYLLPAAPQVGVGHHAG